MILSDLPPERRWHGQTGRAPIVVALIRRHFATFPAATPVEHFLLIKRNGRPYSGHWALVGGKWEFGETLPQAIEREVREETGLKATFTAVRGLVNERLFPSNPDDQGAHFLLLLCELSAENGQPQEQDEGALGWFSEPEIELLKEDGEIVPSDYAIIQLCRDQGAAGLPHVEAEMRAAVRGGDTEPITLLRFQPITGPDKTSSS